MYIIIILGMILFVILFSIYFFGHKDKNENIPSSYDFSNISTENVHNIWKETNIGTDLHTYAYRELKKRRHWENQERESEIKAQEIFKKYSK